MSLSSIVLLSLSIVFLVIGLYESFTFGVAQGYWGIMLSVVFFFIHAYRKRAGNEQK